MGNFFGGFIKIAAFIFASLVVLLMLPYFSPVVFPRVQRPSADFDCDDSALETYRYFQDLGIDARPLVGNLDMDGEDYLECNHVWLLVRSGDREIAYDWGTPRFDRQHYEGYPISLDTLLYAVAEDKTSGGSVAAAPR